MRAGQGLLSLRHCFWFQLFSIAIESDEVSPTCKEYSGSKQNACRIKKLGWIFMRGPERSNQSFDDQRDDDDHQKPRQKSSYARRRTDVGDTDDLLLGDGLRDLQGDDGGRQQTDCPR